MIEGIPMAEASQMSKWMLLKQFERFKEQFLGTRFVEIDRLSLSIQLSLFQLDWLVDTGKHLDRILRASICSRSIYLSYIDLDHLSSIVGTRSDLILSKTS